MIMTRMRMSVGMGMNYFLAGKLAVFKPVKGVGGCLHKMAFMGNKDIRLMDMGQYMA